jgi:hypothetical protein
MYGDAVSVDCTLEWLLWCWAVVLGRVQDLRDLAHRERASEHANLGFAQSFLRDHPEQGGEAARRYVLERWRAVAEQLGVEWATGS